MELARTVLDSLVIKKEAVEENRDSVVLRKIKAALQEEGYDVTEHVGQSGFKCSLAVKSEKNADAYDLSILVDDDSHYANNNLLEQYYQRPEILKDFGWKTISVFAKDWLHDEQGVMEAIKKRLAGHYEPDVEEDSEMPVSGTSIQPLVPETGVSSAAGGLYDQLPYSRLIFSEGASNKFWEVAIDKQKVVIRFGRIGTKGQTQIKTFESVEAAEKVKEKMIREKLSKGYEIEKL